MLGGMKRDGRSGVGEITFDELTAGLVWPLLLRALRMSVQVGRLALAAFGLTVIWLVGSLLEIIQSDGRGDLWLAYPPIWARTAFVVFAMLVVAMVFGAVARMTAPDVAYGLRIGLLRGLAFALGRLLSLLLPVLFVCIVLVVAWLASGAVLWLGASVGGETVTAFFTPLVRVLAGTATAVACVAGLMGVAAVGVEGSDGFDGFQRSAAYLVAAPVRLLGYLLIVLLTYAVGLGVLLLVGMMGSWLVSTWVEADLMTEYWGIVSLAAVWTLSYITSAVPLVYLCIRRAVDEQDVREVWMPGLLGGVLAPEHQRAAAGSPRDSDEAESSTDS